MLRYFLAIVLAAGCAGSAPATGGTLPAPTAASQPTEPECPDGQHACPCATGSYCLGMGMMCRNPTAACPAAP